MRDETRNWLESAEYDLETARYMLSSRRYLYTVFFCHLTLEKALKGMVSEVTGHSPPRSHDLVSLIKLARITMDKNYLDFFGKINYASVPTRYPIDIRKAIDEFSEETTKDYLQQTEEVFNWLKKQLSSMK